MKGSYKMARFVFWFLTIVFIPIGASAWEADLHYGLTKWLALRAGYSPEQAEWIAGADQDVDDSPATDPIRNTYYAACLKNRDKLFSLEVHDRHFPSKGIPRSPASQRVVVAGEVWDRNGTIGSIPMIDGTKQRLEVLGYYLHTLQDTWSHAGAPDIAPNCAPDLAWGHAAVRGGWSCHLADHTYRWKEDTIATAKATYDALVAAGKGRDFVKGRDVVPWDVLKPAVEDFSSAESKWEKDGWFQAPERRGEFPDRTFLQTISLPDCRKRASSCRFYPFGSFWDKWNRITEGKETLEHAPRDVVALFDHFLSGMGNEASAVFKNEVFDETGAEWALASTVHVEGPCPEFYRYMLPYLVGRGFLDGFGAHQPRELCEAVAQLNASHKVSISCKDAIRIAQSGLESLPHGPGLSAFAEQLKGKRPPFKYSVMQSKSGTFYAVASFVHMPTEVLVVEARKNSERAKVTGFFWWPKE